MQSNRATRYFLIENLISLCHSVFAVVVGIIVFICDVPTLRFWEWDSIWQESTTTKQSFVFCTASIYFLCDIFFLCQHPRLRKHEWGLILHHLVCAMGLLVPVLSNRDGTLVLVGYVIGEIPNPARLLSILVDNPKFQGHWLVKWQISLVTLHYALFVSSRVLCMDFLVKVVYYEAQSPLTVLCAVLLLVFSVAVLFEYLNDGGGVGDRASQSSRGLVGLHARHGARRV